MEFNEYFNPATLFLSFMAVIGLLGVIGKIVTHYDNKRGYCNLPDKCNKEWKR